ncbi:hypothetical protein [Acidovorax sp.]|uniref:hypothetical protein n=1 Tax=Acidovorax sp. TaxID=1872122 RepID=UPI00258F114E|nr:hypothetical protein [Acidovorax sp.]
MTVTTACPYCHEPHTLSQCPKWIIAGRPAINAGGAGQTAEGALRGEGAPAAAARAGADLRATMPQTAELIDGLREAFGRTVIDAILRATSKGRPQAYFAELGADGQLREWGRAPSGRRAAVVDGRVVMPCA